MMGQSCERTLFYPISFFNRNQVEIQTAISIAPDTDVAALLQKAIQVGEEEENKENVVSTEIHLSHKHCGVVFSGALARHTEEVYLRASSSLFTYCQHCLRPIYSSQFSHFSDSSGDKTIKEGPWVSQLLTQEEPNTQH